MLYSYTYHKMVKLMKYKLFITTHNGVCVYKENLKYQLILKNIDQKQ